MNASIATISRPRSSVLLALMVTGAAGAAQGADASDPATPRTRAEVQQEGREAMRSGYFERQLRDSYLPFAVAPKTATPRRDTPGEPRGNERPPMSSQTPSPSAAPRSTP